MGICYLCFDFAKLEFFFWYCTLVLNYILEILFHHFKCGSVTLRFAAKLIGPFERIGGGGPILGDLWALKGLIEEG